VLGIVGRNGAGKSTLLQLVCGTSAPTSGTIAVNGRVAALLELGAGFNPEFSGRENAIFAASILGLSQAEIDTRLEQIIDFSGIREFIDQPVKFYSSGMYVRLAFSVATSVDPDVLVIDEALSVGDGEFARKSFDRIIALKKNGVTILFCSHALYQLEAFCDRVLWLEHGNQVMLDKPQRVLQKYTEFLARGDTRSAAPERTGLAAPSNGSTPPPKPGYARFTRIETAVDGHSGRELKARTGESTLAISVQFESDPALPPPVLGVTIDYGTLLAVTCAVTRSDAVVIERDATGRGEAILTFPRLALRKGEYRVGIYLGCENALHIYDGIQHYATLVIEDTLPDPGLVTLPHAWQLTPGHSANEDSAPQTAPSGHPADERDWRQATLADGRRLWIDAADSLGLIANRTFEPAESALCASLLRPGDRVLDIGANLGYYTTLCADRIGANGRVDAVEPDPDNFRLLDANTRELQQAGRVRVHRLALSNKSGTTLLFRSKDNVGMHRVYDSVCCDGSATEVQAKRGDELALAPLDFIKIDIEGFEPAALEGLSSTIARSPRVKILCEFSPLAMLEAGSNPRRWLEWMKAQGFRALAFDGARWTEMATADLHAQAARLDELDIAALTLPLKSANNSTIAAVAAEAAKAHGYTRPVLENLLFVRAEEADEKLEQLLSGSTQAITPPFSPEAAGHDTAGAAGANPADWRVEPAHAADEPALLALFARAFGHEMSPAQWRWKYAGLDPIGTLVRRGNTVIGFYGGMPREVRFHGTLVTVVQIGDVMVDPAERGILTRRGAFFLATSKFADALVGPGRPYLFAFGFPSERHARLGERLGLYTRVDEILDAQWAALPPRPGFLYRTRLLAESELGSIDVLWEKMAAHFGDVVIAVRNGAHVRRRFLQHPAAIYLPLLVRHRFSGAVAGLLILRDREESGIELVDVVAAPEAFPALLTVARRVAGRLGRKRVFAWMTPRAADSFKRTQPQLAPAGIPVPTIVWSAVPDLEKLRGQWWLLGGDADSR
jgi:lipopolysaccharide transport system ATP-binding protein